MKRFSHLVLVVLILLCVMPGVADAHRSQYSGVQSPKLLTYKDNSKYSIATVHDSRSWAGYRCRIAYAANSCPGVTIQATAGTPMVLVLDNTMPGSTWAGLYRITNSSPDQILLNTPTLDRRDLDGKNGTINHEFGHALGFAHPPNTKYYQKYSLMEACTICNHTVFPRSHDWTDYANAWVKGSGVPGWPG